MRCSILIWLNIHRSSAPAIACQLGCDDGIAQYRKDGTVRVPCVVWFRHSKANVPNQGAQRGPNGVKSALVLSPSDGLDIATLDVKQHSTMHIGLLEDDEDQRALMALWIGAAGHTHRDYGTIAEMMDALKRERFDLLLLDWFVPDGNSEEILQWVRRNLGWDVAVVVVTAHDEEAGVVRALQAGADDYVVKPPKQHELLARLTAVARRARPSSLPVLRLGEYEVDIQRHVLSLGGTPVPLTQKEFDLAVYLFQSPGKLLSRDHLLNKIWGLNTDVDTRTVDTHVSRLRKKLLLDGSRGWKMSPVYGYGYRLDRMDEAGG